MWLNVNRSCKNSVDTPGSKAVVQLTITFYRKRSFLTHIKTLTERWYACAMHYVGRYTVINHMHEINVNIHVNACVDIRVIVNVLTWILNYIRTKFGLNITLRKRGQTFHLWYKYYCNTFVASGMLTSINSYEIRRETKDMIETTDLNLFMWIQAFYTTFHCGYSVDK